MTLRIRSPFLLGYVFGWPNEATGSPVLASVGLWWFWFTETNCKGWWQ